MLYTLAGQMTGILSPTDLCRNLDFSLPNYPGSEPARQKRGRKLYFVDGAVRNVPLQRGLGPLSNPTEMSLLLENLVAGHLHALTQQTEVRLYHWRNRGSEVDFIYDEPDSPLGFEVACSVTPPRKGLRHLISRFPQFEGRCFLVAPDAIPAAPEDNPDKIGTLPLDLLLLAVSAQAQRSMELRLALST